MSSAAKATKRAKSQDHQRHFVAVKVDRDERPDVDSRYQSAVSAISGQGGGRLTGILLSDGKPFFGGTYFPARRPDGPLGIPRILLAVADSYRKQARQSLNGRQTPSPTPSRKPKFSLAPVPIRLGCRRHADQVHDPAFLTSRTAALRRAPKFRTPRPYDLILDRYQQLRKSISSPWPKPLSRKWPAAGVYDQLAGASIAIRG